MKYKIEGDKDKILSNQNISRTRETLRVNFGVNFDE